MSAHHCHAKMCKTPCAPERLMCLRHWRMVPKALQAKVWETYRHGQCDDKRPSKAWFVAAHDAIAAVFQKEMPELARAFGERKLAAERRASADMLKGSIMGWNTLFQRGFYLNIYGAWIGRR